LLGGIFGGGTLAETLCEAFECEMAVLRALPAMPPRTVLYCIWKDPWMTVSRNTYIAAMLALIGWQHWQVESEVPADQASRYPKFAWNSAMLEKIDDVLLSSEPYRFTEEHVIALEKQIGKPVRLVDGEMLSWYGSRAIQGLRYLQEIVRD